MFQRFIVIVLTLMFVVNLLLVVNYSDGAGPGYQPMMPSSAQPPAVYSSMQASHHMLLLVASNDN